MVVLFPTNRWRNFGIKYFCLTYLISTLLSARYSYDNVVTFGGCQDDFMLVVTSDSTASASAAGTDRIGQEQTGKQQRYNNHSDRASSEDSLGTTKLLFNAGKPQVGYTPIILEKITLV